MRRHRQERSEAVAFGDDARFRSVCSCAWKSDELRPMQVEQAWQQHVDEQRLSAPSTP